LSQLTLREGEPGQISEDKLASLLKMGLDNGFQLENNDKFSSVLNTKRQLKHKRIPEYRRIHTYFRSTKQYWKLRNRRKQITELAYVYFLSQKEIAAKLGVSLSTVKRDLKKVRRFIRGQTNRALRVMRDEWRQEREKCMEGLPLRERFDYLSLEMERYRKLRPRAYRGHHSIFFIDMTQTDKYGIPKLTLLPRQTANAQLAYPHKVRVRIKGIYEGRTFEADIGGFVITQRTIGW